LPYDACVIQILIASPGDVPSDRAAIADVIYEWNYTNSKERKVVLLPLRWETHAFPEMGVPPQDAINKQVVDDCDMAVGIFWTRLGTPTNSAESGTAEELSRVGESAKPVMLYFSREKVDPESLDIDELVRLKEFKEKKYPQGLVEHYSSTNDLREKFRRQLASRINDVISGGSIQPRDAADSSQDIDFAFAAGNPPAPLSPPNILEILKVTCNDAADIPDYTSMDVLNEGNSTLTVAQGVNKDYYRQFVATACDNNLNRDLHLSVSSASGRASRDLYLEIRVVTKSGTVIIDPPAASWPSNLQNYYTSTSLDTFLATAGVGPTSSVGYGSLQAPSRQLGVQKLSDSEWRMEVNFPIVQAGRTVTTGDSFVIRATENAVVSFDATVYSSDSLPFSLETELQVNVTSMEMSYREILERLIPNYGKVDNGEPTKNESATDEGQTME
jgi:hypothetical protein